MEVVDGEHREGLQAGKREVDVHEDVAATLGDDDVGEQGGEGQEGAGDGEQTQVGGALGPLLAEQGDDELVADERQAEQQGERQEGGKAHHLAQNAQLALALVVDADEYGLCHLLHHVLNDVRTLRAPLEGLVVVARVVTAIEAADEDVQDVVVHVGEHLRDEEFHREAEHLQCWT